MKCYFIILYFSGEDACVLECLTMESECHGFSVDNDGQICEIGTLNDTVKLAKGECKTVYAEKGFIPPKGNKV